MKLTRAALFLVGIAVSLIPLANGGAERDAEAPKPAPAALWNLARNRAAEHRFATLFTAQDVRRHLATPAGRRAAIEWCKKTGVTHVFIETYRDRYQAEEPALRQAKESFLAEGFAVSGCVTTTQIGKLSTGWNEISCFTDSATQEKLQAIFEYTAALFDEIMIDDFWFTDCTCPECDAARHAKSVTVGARQYPVAGDTWEDYRCELMVRLSRDRILAPAKRVNPKARVIIKYPQWYDRFHERGYEVARETADFDRIWVGTETRDYADQRWGGTVQYEAYFIMRWLGGMGGAKCGGGWYDWLGTTERTYVEQARQTVLGGARESLLFCYGGLQGDTGPANIEALRTQVPELLEVARELLRRNVIGIAAYKPVNSHPDTESRVFDFVGMLGLPLVPGHEFPTNAPAAFFSIHALKDAGFAAKLKTFIAAGKPVLVTDGLADRLGDKLDRTAPNVRVLPVKGDPKSLLTLPAVELNALREVMLRPWGVRFTGPVQVGLYLFRDRSWVIENFNEQEASVEFNGQSFSVPARGWKYQWNRKQI